MSEVLDPVLVAVLACPRDKGPLWWVADEGVLYNPRLRLLYRVEDGIPVLLVDEASPATDEQHERWSARHAAGELEVTGSAGRGPDDAPAGGPS